MPSRESLLGSLVLIKECGSREPPLPKGRGTALAVEGYMKFAISFDEVAPYPSSLKLTTNH